MVTSLDGRVVIVTGAGRGLGREHALALAANGARVVVNDLGSDVRGTGSDATAAEEVVGRIRSSGGDAVASGHDVADWNQARDLVSLAVRTFGELHAVVNNAGILRDRTLAKMTEDDWDAVVRVHLKGHAAPTAQAMAYWRDQARGGQPVDRPALVHTTSASGFVGNFGQSNYGAAKMAVVALSQIARLEGASYGVRSNAVGPVANTRMAVAAPGADEPEHVDQLDPACVSPLVAWLVGRDCPANGQLLHVYGNRIVVLQVPAVVADLHAPSSRWSMEALDELLAPNLVEPADLEYFLPSDD